MIFGPLMMLVYIAVVIVLVVLAVRWLSGARHGVAAGSEPRSAITAINVLEKRYARGEIDEVEFEERMRLLSK